MKIQIFQMIEGARKARGLTLLSETGRLRNQSPKGGKECDRRREKKKPDHKNIKGQ